jgi:hypothetical protein
MTTPNLSKQTFWDTNYDTLDFEKDSTFIMRKVFNFGTWNDVKAVVAFYGRERIKREVVQLADQKKNTLSFLCLLLDLNKDDFKWYLRRQSYQRPWNY